MKSPFAHPYRLLRRASIAGAATALGIALALPATRVTAHDAGQGRLCRESTLRGDYGLLVSGVRRVPFGPFAGQTELMVGVGIRTFDGHGAFTDSGGGLHGQLTGVIGAGEVIVGTYSVNPDCTGISSFTPPVPNAPPIVSAFVIVENGRQIKEAVMQPTPNVVTVLLDRK